MAQRSQLLFKLGGQPAATVNGAFGHKTEIPYPVGGSYQHQSCRRLLLAPGSRCPPIGREGDLAHPPSEVG
jgi:hypothetical protein